MRKTNESAHLPPPLWAGVRQRLGDTFTKVQSSGAKFLSPVNLWHKDEEPHCVGVLHEVPLVVAEVIIGLIEPVGVPGSSVGVRPLKMTSRVVRMGLPALAVGGSKLLPTPAIGEVKLWVGEPQHDRMRESRESSVTLLPLNILGARSAVAVTVGIL